jgi:hypothetical protein
MWFWGFIAISLLFLLGIVYWIGSLFPAMEGEVKPVILLSNIGVLGLAYYISRYNPSVLILGALYAVSFILGVITSGYRYGG